MSEPHAHLEIPEDNLALMQEYAANNDEPIVMVNLMQVRDTAQYERSASHLRCRNIDSLQTCLLYTSPSPRDQRGSRMAG